MSGAPPAVLEAARAKLKPSADGCFDVWPENWEAFAFFTSLQTQWLIVTGMSGGVKTGLDYCRVESAMNMLGIHRKKRPALLRDVQTMERAALAAWIK